LLLKEKDKAFDAEKEVKPDVKKKAVKEKK